MCVIPALLGKAIGGRTGGIIGAGLSGGVLPAVGASMLMKKKKPAAPSAPPINTGGFG